jgi:predicted TIM-barrel fold metal-dependent hydrolase
LPVGAIRLLKVIANALSAGLGFARRKVSDYLSDNFILTTSGHFHTRTLLNAIGEIGSDRLLFSIDYPYEGRADAVEWFDIRC